MSGSEPLKVLMLTSSYPRNKADSAGLFVRHLAENISQRGIEVHVLTPSDAKGGTFIENNIVIHRFQYFPLTSQGLAYGSGILPNLRCQPWLWIQVPFFIFCMTYSLFRIIRKENPSLIHVHWILPQGLVAVIAKMFCNVRVITTAHGSDAFTLKGSLLDSLKRIVLCKSDAWTSNTRATSMAIGQTRLPKPQIIPMGVHVKRFQNGRPERLRAELSKDDFLVLFVGRLIKEKGVEDLLKSISLLPPDLINRTHLWIVGEGDQVHWLKNYSDTLGTGANVRFYGPIANDQLADFYSAADLLVMPSTEVEGQGLVILEAFAARLCVIATRVGGISEAVEDGYSGVLIEPHHPEQLSTAIQKLLYSDQLRRELTENAFSKVQRYYDWVGIAKDFEDLYRRTLQTPLRKAHSSNPAY